ncbi:aquaporin family protein [Martelella alba]|uniref:Aquaporin family protein n=1 Tax=Martelella alba TaxID=2590451 RepID=A0A506U7F3_9HYPH|nr:MIP/aquaporin family protein [Martelella alba]TPW29790.1 aquaporin family protein [Martelella alba]
MNERVSRAAAEFVGTAALLATVIGSGIMADTLSVGAAGTALFGNVIPTAAILYVLILALGPVSGAHFNPVVTSVFLKRGEIGVVDATIYVVMQCAGAVFGVWIAHAMFDLSLLQVSDHVRSGPGQWLGEWVATFGLMLTILCVRVSKPDSVAAAVALYIASACWFTASTSFANPAVTFARAFSDTYAGIRPQDVLPFILFQFLGGFAGHYCSAIFLAARKR